MSEDEEHKRINTVEQRRVRIYKPQIIQILRNLGHDVPDTRTWLYGVEDDEHDEGREVEIQYVILEWAWRPGVEEDKQK